MVGTSSQMEDSETVLEIKDGNHFFGILLGWMYFIHNKIEERNDVISKE